MYAKLHGAYPKNGNGEDHSPNEGGVMINLIGLSQERAQELLAKIHLLEANNASHAWCHGCGDSFAIRQSAPR